MKKYWFLIILLYSIVNHFGCTDMNDKHDIYLQEGEILYIGRIDSAKLFAGNQRFLLRYWITDSRAKELKVYWERKKDSLVAPIPVHDPLDSIDIIIGNDLVNIPEGSHTIEVITTDGENLRSIKYERIINVYGPKYASTLYNRQIREVAYNSINSTLIIDWSDAVSIREIGIEFSYSDKELGPVILKLSTEQIGSQTVLHNVDPDQEITYRTMFLPEPLAIDTFYTEVESISTVLH